MVQFITPNTLSANVWKETTMGFRGLMTRRFNWRGWREMTNVRQLQHRCLGWRWWGGWCSKPRWSECRSPSRWAWRWQWPEAGSCSSQKQTAEGDKEKRWKQCQTQKYSCSGVKFIVYCLMKSSFYILYCNLFIFFFINYFYLSTFLFHKTWKYFHKYKWTCNV